MAHFHIWKLQQATVSIVFHVFRFRGIWLRVNVANELLWCLTCQHLLAAMPALTIAKRIGHSLLCAVHAEV